MRLYFTEYASSARFGVRPLQIAAIVGAIIIGAVLHATSDVPLSHIALWCAAIALGEAAIVVINGLFLKRRPPDAALERWAQAKAALAALGAFGWSLAPMLLHVDGRPLTAIVPPWTIIMFCCGAVWAGAFYAPALFAMILCSALPAAVWLLEEGRLERAAGFCLLIAVPYFMYLGRAASLRYRAAVNDKLEIQLLMQKQDAYTRRIEQLSAERARFFSAASHDLRQPLHAMGLYLSVLRDSPRGAERGEIIESLSQCASSLDTQFNAILGVNETEKLIEQAKPRAVPLQGVFARLAAQVRPKASASGLEFRVVRTSAWALVAPDILERVLSNLLSNAVRYTKKGGVLLGARRGSGVIHILVVDTGVGIAGEHRDAVFEDFFQIDNPSRNREHGFGLGLGIVQRLCAGMHWPVTMHSRVGHGTTFAITVPLAAPAAPSAETEAPLESAPSLLHGRAVLVVDDDEHVRDSMRLMLGKWGVHAEFCETADQALAILADGDPDRKWHVLADYRLSGHSNGLDLAMETLRLYGDRALAAIVTGETDETLEARAARSGVVILRKPVQPVRLRALLAR